MAEIILTNGKIVLVDDEDFIRLNKYSWYQQNSGYATAKINRKNILMHRLILHDHYSEDKKYTDHINHNKLDNRKENLRVATKSQNAANQLKCKEITSSKYKGVCWHKGNKKWQANIKINNKVKYLGIYTNEVEAAKKYDEEAKQIFGEFALVNFK